MMHDLAYGYDSLEDALNEIQARVLMVSCTRDLLQPTVYNEEMVNILKSQGKKAELYKIESITGHMAGVLETNLFSHKVAEFLEG